MTKSIWVSKTFWLNIIGLAVLALNQMGTVLPPNAAPYIAAALAALNILMRFLTEVPVSLMGGPK